MMTCILITLVYLLISGIITHGLNRQEMRNARARFQAIQPTVDYPILMPVCSRPQYLKRVLDALSQAQDIEKTLLIISQDGNNAEVTQLVQHIDFAPTIIVRHTRPFLGILSIFWDNMYAVSSNIYFLLQFAYKLPGVKGAIVLEDDIVPSVDFFAYFTWAFGHVLENPSVMSVTGFNLHSRAWAVNHYHPDAYPYDLVRNRRDNGQDNFTGWSWAITRTMWQRIRKHWSFFNWDIELAKTQRQFGLISYKPVLGRAKNIGMEGINFARADTDPKWQEVYLSQHPYPYDVKPNLLERDPVIPPFECTRSKPAYVQEKKRTRKNRLLLGLFVLIASAIEVYIWFFWLQ